MLLEFQKNRESGNMKIGKSGNMATWTLNILFRINMSIHNISIKKKSPAIMRRNLGEAQRPTKTGVRGQSPRLLFINSSLILVFFIVFIVFLVVLWWFVLFLMSKFPDSQIFKFSDFQILKFSNLTNNNLKIYRFEISKNK